MIDTQEFTSVSNLWVLRWIFTNTASLILLLIVFQMGLKFGLGDWFQWWLGFAILPGIVAALIQSLQLPKSIFIRRNWFLSSAISYVVPFLYFTPLFLSTEPVSWSDEGIYFFIDFLILLWIPGSMIFVGIAQIVILFRKATYNTSWAFYFCCLYIVGAIVLYFGFASVHYFYEHNITMVTALSTLGVATFHTCAGLLIKNVINHS